MFFCDVRIEYKRAAKVYVYGVVEKLVYLRTQNIQRKSELVRSKTFDDIILIGMEFGVDLIIIIGLPGVFD